MSKKVYLDKTAREELKKGIDLLSNAVASTLGPSGKTVIIDNGQGDFNVTKDGVTVANSIDSDKPMENLGIQYAKKVSSKTDTDNGDGTTTATVVLRAMIDRGFSDNPVDVISYKEGMVRARTEIVDFIEKNAIAINYSDKKRILDIATISANNDKDLSPMIAEAVIKSGEFGHVNIIESISRNSSIEVIEGFVIDLGMADRKFANDKSTGYFLAQDAKMLLMKGKLIDKQKWFAITGDMERHFKNQPLIILAQDYSQEILALGHHINSINNGLNVCFLRNNLRDNEFESIYEDVAAFTGAEIVDSYNTMDVFGDISSAVVKQGYTVFGESTSNIDFHIDSLKERIQKSKSISDQKSYEKRISKLQDGVVSFFVGGSSEAEMKERKDRVVDSVSSCKAAIAEGIIIGGGQLLWKISPKIPKFKNADFENGYCNVFDSVKSIFNQICKNCSESSEEIMFSILDSKNLKYGYNFKTKEFGNLVKLGVIDPAKVTKNAIINAESLASTLLTTECVIIEQ